MPEKISYKNGFSEINYIMDDNGCKIPDIIWLVGEERSIFDGYEYSLSPLPCLKDEVICNPVFSIDDSGCKVPSPHCISPLKFNVIKKIDTTKNTCFVEGKQYIYLC